MITTYRFLPLLIRTHVPILAVIQEHFFLSLLLLLLLLLFLLLFLCHEVKEIKLYNVHYDTVG